MARTFAAIRQSIIDRKNADAVLSTNLTSTSEVAEWNLWVNVMAMCQFVLEGLWDAFKIDVEAIVTSEKAHTLRWYVGKAKAFQLGYELPDDSDVYDPIDAAALIVTQASATENAPFVDLKVVKGDPGAYGALESDTLIAFTKYMNRIKDAGVRLRITSSAADDLRVAYTIYYDPLVLNSEGKRLDGTNDNPVREAIQAFISKLPFNGLLVMQQLTAYLVANVQGVVIADLVSASSRYGVLPYEPVDIEVRPNGGHILLDADDFDTNVVYIAHYPL